MQRILVQLVAARQLHQLAQVHHRDAIADVADDGEVVGDEEVGEAELLLQVFQQVDDLRLNRDVKRGDRLVGDDEVWLDGERAGDADALPLAAGELVREAAGVERVEADDTHELRHPFAALLALRQTVDRQRLADDRAGRHARIERCVGILEDHLHLAAHAAQIATLELRQLYFAELDGAARRTVELQDRAARRRLAAAALADEAERLALADVKRHAVNGLHIGNFALEDQAGRHREVDLQVADLQQDVSLRPTGRRGVLRLGRHSDTSASPPFRLSDTRCHSQQAARCLSSTGISGGASALQRSTRNVQRS